MVRKKEAQSPRQEEVTVGQVLDSEKYQEAVQSAREAVEVAPEPEVQEEVVVTPAPEPETEVQEEVVVTPAPEPEPVAEVKPEPKKPEAPKPVRSNPPPNKPAKTLRKRNVPRFTDQK